MNIVEQLTFIYHHFENWHKSKMSVEESNKYHEKLLMQGNIIVCVIDEKVVGYVEAWRINYEQFGRIICGENIFFDEDRLSGDICYLANTWIDEAHRNSDVIFKLKQEFFKNNSNCDYYVGEARRKRTGLVKVFKKEELQSSLFRLGRR